MFRSETSSGPIVDLTLDPNAPPLAKDLTFAMNVAMYNADWDVLVTQTTKKLASPARKAFTEFMFITANHPYYEKFALTRPLTRKEKSQRMHAVSSTVHIIYHILWHCRVKIPGVKQKTQQQTMADVPEAKASHVISIGKDIKDQVLYAIRRLAGSRRNSLRNRQLKVPQ